MTNDRNLTRRYNQTIGIIGGGIIGLATAYKLQQKFPGIKVIVLEKEDSVGQHQSGRNSGVLHSGLYYQPGSLKARLAVSGISQMVEFCEQFQIPHDICGKIVVATNEHEVPLLHGLAKRGNDNSLTGLRFINAAELRDREPYVRAVEALLVPQEGIADFRAVMRKFVELIEENGSNVYLSHKVNKIMADRTGDSLVVSGDRFEIPVDYLISCGGLFADRNYSSYTKIPRPMRIVPFRGEYLMLKPHANHLLRHLVYPVPDPQFPFLGVHFTRLISGDKEVGPNAVLAFKREGYKLTDISPYDMFDALSYGGFLRFIGKHFSFVSKELLSSIFSSVFISKAQRLIPDIRSSDLISGSAGVRAQAVSPEGELLMDFDVRREGRQIHVLNAPSPGATASLSIADYIISKYIDDIN